MSYAKTATATGIRGRFQCAAERVRRWLRVTPVPVTYRGVRMASTLEADWACTFDALGWSWSYEPIALRLSDGQVYRCDFYLPAQRVWCEVKGPHNLRIDKPATLHRDLGADGDDWRAPLVAVCREPIADRPQIERADGGALAIRPCGRCTHWTLVDLDGAWQCRICGHWEEATGLTVAELPPFARMPHRWSAA